VVEGGAGDVLVFDGYLPHSGMRNVSGAPRRTLQMAFRAIELRARYAEKRDLAAEPPAIRYLLGHDA
jgi:ectoine hydroxylase-related dioxygenase (phytanoyl-CoA dioxygenase family)